jgi:hypothetical protein
MSAALKKRMPEVRDDQTFDPKKPGHMIKMITGLIQDYGALKETEVILIMDVIGFPIRATTFRQFAQTVEAMGWIAKDRRNLATFYTATSKKDALRFKFLPGKVTDRARWRAEILQYWKDKEKDRFDSIVANRPAS